MKAAITGATGHVGVTLSRTLKERGHSVRALVRRSAPELVDLGIELVTAGLDDTAALTGAFRGCEVVFHAAARISISRFDEGDVQRVNVGGTRNVIAACRAARVHRLVYFSSIEAIEATPFDTPVDEDRPPVDAAFGSPYAVSKARAEREVAVANGADLETVVVNPTAIIGPFDHRPSLLGRAILAFAEGRLPFLIDGGFDWVDVRDVAEGALAAAERGAPGRRYVLGGRWASMTELARIVCREADVPAPHLVCPYALARAWAPVSTAYCRLTGREPLFTAYTLRVLRGNRNVSHARAERDLGYAPRELEDTVRDTLSWFGEQGLLWRGAVAPEYTAAGETRE
jgi:dihydroflavonol-4-reductase